jgi:hypothetical protein
VLVDHGSVDGGKRVGSRGVDAPDANV